MTRQPSDHNWMQRHLGRFVFAFAILVAGCDNLLDSNGIGLFQSGKDGKERWSILCLRSNEPGHQEQCKRLAEMLGRVSGLNSSKVRVVTDETGSTIYYGEYFKVTSKKTGRLVFPQQLQDDIELIRRLSYNQLTPFFHARPASAENGQVSDRGKWDVSKAKGAYTLQIAVFYDTPTFHERKEVAEQYVQMLRDAGYDSYYRHEVVKSHVFVGDFNESDIIETPEGRKMGPKVERLITSNEEEFRYFSENGYFRKNFGPDGKAIRPLSYLVPVPRDENLSGLPRREGGR